MKKFLNRQWRKDTGSHHLDPLVPTQKTVEEIGRQPVKDGPGWQMSLDGNFVVLTCEFTIPPPEDAARMVGTFVPSPNSWEITNPNGLRTVVMTPMPDAPKGVWSPFDENGFVDDARLAAMGFHPLGTMSEDSEIEIKRR